MHKLTIKKNIDFTQGILRQYNRWSGTDNLISGHCNKLNENFEGEFVSLYDPVVIIKDKRLEITRMPQRSILTTGLLYDELLQVNRGYQNPEIQRNKFFVDDITGNTTAFGKEEYLTLLDLLWYMDEQKADAIEILPAESGAPNYRFLSNRYSDMATQFLDGHVEKGLKELIELGDALFSLFKEIGGGEINYNTSFYTYFHTERQVEDIRSNVDEYGIECVVISNYMEHRLYQKQKNLVPLSWSEFAAKHVNENKKQPCDVYSCEIASLFGMSKTHKNFSSVYIALGKRNVAVWETVAKSEFKRSVDWQLTSLNFYKSEVLKLRRNLLEGTFSE